jgi:hypothetical protein
MNPRNVRTPRCACFARPIVRDPPIKQMGPFSGPSGSDFETQAMIARTESDPHEAAL